MALTKVSGDILDNGINVAGVVTATAFHGPVVGAITGTASTASFAATAYSLSGNVGDIIANDIIANDITNRHINSSGIVTATAFYGSGVNLTGVSGFGTALDNTQGNLGNNAQGAAGTRSSPVQIAGGGGNWNLASKGWEHGLATKTDNTLWVWGENWYGELGLNSRVSYSSPDQLPGTSSSI